MRVNFSIFHTVDWRPQCKNFGIFLSFRFYVKSILENLEILKKPILQSLSRGSEFVDLGKFQQ